MNIKLAAVTYPTYVDVSINRPPNIVKKEVEPANAATIIHSLLFDKNSPANYILVNLNNEFYLCEPINSKSYRRKQIFYHPYLEYII